MFVSFPDGDRFVLCERWVPIALREELVVHVRVVDYVHHTVDAKRNASLGQCSVAGQGRKGLVFGVLSMLLVVCHHVVAPEGWPDVPDQAVTNAHLHHAVFYVRDIAVDRDVRPEVNHVNLEFVFRRVWVPFLDARLEVTDGAFTDHVQSAIEAEASCLVIFTF